VDPVTGVCYFAWMLYLQEAHIGGVADGHLFHVYSDDPQPVIIGSVTLYQNGAWDVGWNEPKEALTGIVHEEVSVAPKAQALALWILAQALRP
jgi:hypothetical protein